MIFKKFSKLSNFSAICWSQKRFLNLQEHISYSILNEHGVKTPRFGNAKCAAEAEKIAQDLLTKNLIVKAQVLAGGRMLGKFQSGLNKGVHTAGCPEEVKDIAEKMIGQVLVTKQTGSEGKICNSVMVAERKFPRREFYFGFAMDPAFGGPLLIASRFGGVNIEETAANDPKSVIREPVDIATGLTKEMASWIVRRVGIDQPAATIKMLCNLYDLFIKKDALLVEVNPYVEDVCLNYYVLDAKFSFDESAKFRQEELFKCRDETQEDPKEVFARNKHMSFISLDGSVGCLVNGAGLAMATNDLINLYGGRSANFLDVGSMASVEGVIEAVRIIMLDKKVLTIFINIYGGMIRCDTVVEGLMKAMKQFDVAIPVVVRLQGNKSKEGQKMIREAKTNMITREDFADAVKTAVSCSKIMQIANDNELEAKLSMLMKCDCEPIPKAPTSAGNSLSKVSKADAKQMPKSGGVIFVPNQTS